jgi:putative ubiquitin-RnfH superfamily antitoxin RatB of RatAB toxin-antitoxin module
VKVTVVWATRAIQDVVEVDLPPGATIADAIAKSGLVAQYELDAARLGFAVFGRRASAQTPLAEGDRIDLTRPLEVDPKAARIARARAKPVAKSPRRVKAHRSK